MTKFTGVIVVGILLYSGEINALTLGQLQELRTVVIEICRGGSMQGETKNMSIIATASGKVVVIKRFMEGGADAKIEFTNAEWKGIKALADSDGYTACVDSTLDKFIAALKS